MEIFLLLLIIFLTSTLILYSIRKYRKDKLIKSIEKYIISFSKDANIILNDQLFDKIRQKRSYLLMFHIEHLDIIKAYFETHFDHIDIDLVYNIHISNNQEINFVHVYPTNSKFTLKNLYNSAKYPNKIESMEFFFILKYFYEKMNFEYFESSYKGIVKLIQK